MSDEINKLDISDEMIAERRGNQNKMPDDSLNDSLSKNWDIFMPSCMRKFLIRTK